jgi:hypothetical protein
MVSYMIIYCRIRITSPIGKPPKGNLLGDSLLGDKLLSDDLLLADLL